MTTEWSVPAWAAVVIVGVLAILLVTAVVVALRARAAADRRVAAAESATTALRDRLDALEAKLASAPASPGGDRVAQRPEPEFVITSLGQTASPDRVAGPAPALPAQAFADAVLRDTVVQAAALVHGVRRALSPEVRNRIRFEMRRELKRTRKERKSEVREALREYRARHRANVPQDALRDGAA